MGHHVDQMGFSIAQGGADDVQTTRKDFLVANDLFRRPTGRQIGHEETLIDLQVELPRFAATIVGPPRGTPDFYALDLLIDILASGDSSRFEQNIVRQGLAAAAFTGLAEGLDYVVEVTEGDGVLVHSPGQGVYEDRRQLAALLDLLDAHNATYLLASPTGRAAAIRAREIAVDDVETRSASPFARSLVFAYTATYLYQLDLPAAERRT